MTEHVHQWKRWPPFDLNLNYTCAECGEPESICWAADGNPGKNISDLDQMLVARRGGVFAGEIGVAAKDPALIEAELDRLAACRRPFRCRPDEN